MQSVKDSQFSASSTDVMSTPADARLSGFGWRPRSDDASPWIQVNFGEPVSVAGIITKGLDGAPVWTKHYTITYSDDCVQFDDVTGPDGQAEVSCSKTR